MAYYKDDDVIEAIYDALRTPPLKGVLTDTMSLAVAMAKKITIADVREVTLCKNCKNASSYWIEGMIFCEDMECPNLEDGFCNHAERGVEDELDI